MTGQPLVRTFDLLRAAPSSELSEETVKLAETQAYS